MGAQVRRLGGMTAVVAIVASAVLSASAGPTGAAGPVYVGDTGCSDVNAGSQASPVCTKSSGCPRAAPLTRTAKTRMRPSLVTRYPACQAVRHRWQQD
jgi:hypothetical protein